MPGYPCQPCTYPGCGGLSRDNSGRCLQHLRPAWETSTGQPTSRLRGRPLQRARTALFRANPLCVICQAAGRVTLATIRDHIIPLTEGGTDSPDNTQGLCPDCHTAKSLQEALRGRE